MTAEVILSVWNILASFFIFLRGRRQRRTEKYDNQETQTDESFNKVQKEKKPVRLDLFTSRRIILSSAVVTLNAGLLL